MITEYEIKIKAMTTAQRDDLERRVNARRGAGNKSLFWIDHNGTPMVRCGHASGAPTATRGVDHLGSHIRVYPTTPRVLGHNNYKDLDDIAGVLAAELAPKTTPAATGHELLVTSPRPVLGRPGERFGARVEVAEGASGDVNTWITRLDAIDKFSVECRIIDFKVELDRPGYARYPSQTRTTITLDVNDCLDDLGYDKPLSHMKFRLVRVG